MSTVPVEKQELAKMDLMQSYSDYLQAVAGALAGRATEEVHLPASLPFPRVGKPGWACVLWG